MSSSGVKLAGRGFRFSNKMKDFNHSWEFKTRKGKNRDNKKKLDKVNCMLYFLKRSVDIFNFSIKKKVIKELH